MKEASRIQEVIQVLAQVLSDKQPADIILDKYLKERRYIGAKDRRFIIDTVWQIIRKRLRLTQLLPEPSPRLMTALFFDDKDLDLLFNGEEYAPTPLTPEEKTALSLVNKDCDFTEESFYECPRWLMDKFSDKRLLHALNSTAPVDVRANLTSRDAAKERLRKEGLFFSPTPFSPFGLRSEERLNLNNCMTYQDGEIEVMDEGSQLLALLCRAKPQHKIIDYCAGAGGKALALGAFMNNHGLIWAHDINKERLARIKKRAERLNISNIKTIQSVSDCDYTRFILDAPCSGSGTWRRAPDSKYRLSPQRLADICQTQAQLLEFGAAHTAVNGQLIYMTCSVFAEENEKQIENFLRHHPDFTPLNHRALWENVLDIKLYPFDTSDYLHLTPLNTKTDGFFFCALKKTC